MQKIEFALGQRSFLVERLRAIVLFRWIPENLWPRTIFAAMLAWLPLLILTAPAGVALGHRVQVPFLFDLVQYARFLVALPCTMVLGRFINPRLNNVLNGFLKSRIVSSNDLIRFRSAISRARTLTHSIVAELLILALVYVCIALGLHHEVSNSISTWNRTSSDVIIDQAAGWWFLWVSMPLLLFCTFLWLWRLGVWSYLLFQISRLDLRVVATHPDGVGGLNFVHVGMRRFSLLVFAISSILCASIAEEILFNGGTLQSYELELTACFFGCVAVILGPLVVFTPKLARSKLEYWGKYGPFSSYYVQGFDDKWISQTQYRRQDPLGTPDLQSLADLRNSYAGIAQTRTVLPNRATIGIFAGAFLLPALPLLTTVISLRRIVSELYALLLK